MAGRRPVVAEGRTDHPLSQGGICPLGAAAVQMLYRPARIKGPMKKQADGTHQPISWEQAEGLLAEKLVAQKGKKNAVACISGDENGTINEVFSAFLAKMGSDAFFLMPGEQLTATKAKVFGNENLGYDLENSDVVLIFGADILDSWGTIVRNKKAFGAARPMGQEPTVEYIAVGPMQNVTCGAVDQWISVPPGLEGVVALGVAHLLLQAGLTAKNVKDFPAYRSFVLNRYTPEHVSRVTGVSPEQLSMLADKLRMAQKPLIIPGSPTAQGGSVFNFAAVLSLNFLLGSVRDVGGVVLLPDLPTVVDGAMAPINVRSADLVAYVQKLAEGKADKPEVLMVYEANPVHALPQAEALAKAFEDIYLVSFSTFYDETAARADLLLPAPYFLERLDDVQTPYGSGFASYSMTRPVIKPVMDTKPTGDVILEQAQKLGLPLGFASFEDVLRAKVGKLTALEGFLVDKVQPWQVRAGADVTPVTVGPWLQVSRGAVWASTQQPPAPVILLGAAVLAQAAPPDAEDWAYPVRLAVMDSRTFGSRSIAIPPFCLPLLGEQELYGDMFYVQMNSTTAGKYGLKVHDKVELTGPLGSCIARVRIFEGVGPNVVVAPLGFGHTAWDEFSRGKGDNVNNVLTVRTEPGSELSVWADSRVRIAKA
jgi:anaerobic selenocysteine-containing dehydrogenase